MAFVSAGAYAREVDLSLYAETITSTILGMAHTFNKGPIGTPTLITNIDRLIAEFGEPIDPGSSSSACQGWFAAREYLRKGNKLYVNRVESTATPAAYAAQSVRGVTDQTLATGTDGATSVPATRTLTSATGDFVNDGILVGDVLEVDEGGADDGFYVLTAVAATVLTIDRDWPTGSLADQDFTVWTAKKEEGEDGVTSALGVRTLTSAASTFQTNGVAAGDILKIADPGDTGDNGVYYIASVDSETQLTVNRDWQEGGLSTLTFTVYGPNSSGATGSTATAGEFADTNAKFQDHGVQAGDILWIKDAVDIGDNGYYMITGLKTGSEDTTLEVNETAWPAGSLTGLTYEVFPGSVTYQGATKGTAFSGLRIIPSVNANDNTKVDLETKNSAGTFRLEKVFSMDRTDADTVMSSDSAYWTATIRSNRSDIVAGDTFTVSGGDDGYTGIVDSDYIGNSTLGTGLRGFSNAEAIDVNLLVCPGQSSQNVQDELINICESRADCMAIVDPPDWSAIDTVQEILNFHNGTLTRTTALNTTYGALYWTWQKVYDEYHDVDVWTAPSGHMAAVYANNDNVQAPWFAPAGLKRGKLTGSTDVRYSPNQDDRDALYGPGARVNPIVNFTGSGIYAFGQKTLTTATTALDRVNVRRMLLYVEKVIATASRQLVFDPNDDVLEREFKQLVEPVLDDVLSRRGIAEYLITTATTDSDRDNNKAVFKIFIKPIKSAEIIEIVFALTSQGANFSELIAA